MAAEADNRRAVHCVHVRPRFASLRRIMPTPDLAVALRHRRCRCLRRGMACHILGHITRSPGSIMSSAAVVYRPAAPAEQPPAPGAGCTLVIFGAAGDLTRRLLTPTLYNLACD